MDKLIAKINQWADDRNLKQADPKIQWMRVRWYRWFPFWDGKCRA